MNRRQRRRIEVLSRKGQASPRQVTAEVDTRSPAQLSGYSIALLQGYAHRNRTDERTEKCDAVAGACACGGWH